MWCWSVERCPAWRPARNSQLLASSLEMSGRYQQGNKSEYFHSSILHVSCYLFSPQVDFVIIYVSFHGILHYYCSVLMTYLKFPPSYSKLYLHCQANFLFTTMLMLSCRLLKIPHKPPKILIVSSVKAVHRDSAFQRYSSREESVVTGITNVYTEDANLHYSWSTSRNWFSNFKGILKYYFNKVCMYVCLYVCMHVLHFLIES